MQYQSMDGKQWHSLTVKETADTLQTDLSQGLSAEEAEKRLRHFGPNEVPRKKKKSLILLFLSQFSNPLVLVLIASAIITLFLKHNVDAIVIFAVVAANAVIGFFQEERAENAIESLSKMLSQEGRVLREGKLQKIPAAFLVPGDVVMLESGDRVPADIRLSELKGALMNESLLTGESVPAFKSSEPSAIDAPVAERVSMAFSGTLMVGGAAKGIVTATGVSTEIGKISGLILQAQTIETPLTMKLKRFSFQLSIAAMLFCILLFLGGIFTGHSPSEMFNASVAIAVAIIPEGLPAVVTIILAVGVRRMADRNAIIRNLPSVETLGSVSVICSDKTGTLTTNEMTVKHVIAGRRLFEFGGIGYNPHHCCVVEETAETSAKDILPLPEALTETLRCGLLCNTSAIEEQEGLWKAVGDPTEAALIAAARKGGLSEKEHTLYPRLDILPFDSGRMYMASLHRNPQGNSILYVKGSVEQIIDNCQDMLGGKSVEPLQGKEILKIAGERASLGYRVLAFAEKTMDTEIKEIEEKEIKSLTFLGLQAMSDPARPEAVKAVLECKSAGIEVKMITGDHKSTAQAIAHDLGIQTEDESVYTGKDLENLTGEDFDNAAISGKVFARIAPEQKYRLVEALQKKGKIVAMTGDGFNDAAAIRKADIGVAMGLAGSDVAKEAADMVLADDNFATIVSAVEEGRTVFSNLSKSLAWILPTNLGEGLIIVAALILGVTLPVTPVQILWINTVTAVLLGLPLAFEPMEKEIMTESPRPREAPLINKYMVQRIIMVAICIVTGSFLIFELAYSVRGLIIEEARSAAVAVIVCFEIFYLFMSRSERAPLLKLVLASNPYVWIGVLLALSLQFAFTYIPFMNTLFGSAPISAELWLDIILVSLLVVPVVSVHRILIRRSE
ncbi:MAG: cation-translocating P-type ATPase [Candidatus Xenobiia bacterium LiM19]